MGTDSHVNLYCSAFSHQLSFLTLISAQLLYDRVLGLFTREAHISSFRETASTSEPFQRRHKVYGRPRFPLAAILIGVRRLETFYDSLKG